MNNNKQPSVIPLVGNEEGYLWEGREVVSDSSLAARKVKEKGRSNKQKQQEDNNIPRLTKQPVVIEV